MNYNLPAILFLCKKFPHYKEEGEVGACERGGVCGKGIAEMIDERGRV